MLALTLLSSCEEERQPPATFLFELLPVSGSLADARRAGLTDCVSHNVEMRCRKEGLFFRRHGPFSAAVDLGGGDGAGGFDHLTLWHSSDQSALVAVTNDLRSEGWSECLTPSGADWKGKAIYQQRGSPVFLALDLTYWDRRSLTLFRAVPTNIPACRAHGQAG
ncbi:hypothetical protein [Sphingomonas swuensis]|uniref:hypothetical protein n=1 Tax=Sphingomonas swuensis TaxID=977800 RepID=UPI0031D6B913